MTYASLALHFDIHPRAAAMILKNNTEPDIYPCYKVVHADGRIGWYSGPGGVDGKISRLQKDGIIIQNGRVSKDCII